MSKTVVGIDVSKETLDVVLLVKEQRRERSFRNDRGGFGQLVSWLGQQQAREGHVCLEATGRYSLPVTKYLYEEGVKVSMVNPARIKAYRDSQLKRNKTDRLDAYVIADFCRTQNPPTWQPPSPEVEELQALSRYLEDMDGQLQQERNRLSSGIESEYVIHSITDHMAYLSEQRKAVMTAMDEHIAQHEELKQQSELLCSIPGIGKLTAARLLAEIVDVRRFDNAAQLAAYAGVTPRQFYSGTSVHKKSRMSKMGNVHLRKALFMPAISAKKNNPVIREFCQRLEHNGKLKIVAVGAAMRKLLHLVFGVLKHKTRFDPHYAKSS